MDQLPPANTDEARVPAYAPADLELAGLTPEGLAERQQSWRRLAGMLYFPIPQAPDRIEVARRFVVEEGYTHLALTLRSESRFIHEDTPGRLTRTESTNSRSFTVDAALWLPPDAAGPVPLIVGLGFLGPAAVLHGESFPIDREARVEAAAEIGLADRRLAEHVRGLHAARWPLPLILGAGYGLLLSCYGSWAPDDPERFLQHGVWPLLGLQIWDDRPGALTLWAWAYSRLVDVALGLPEVDPARIVLAGHSRLGKAALWAAACDTRVAAVLANNGGCLGTALSCRDFGETPRHLAARFPHWVTRRLAHAASEGTPMPIDQHAVMACVAPRRIYVASAAEDHWADPRGEYEALRAAAPAWAAAGAPQPEMPEWPAIAAPGASWVSPALGWHLRPGGHGLTPWDWRRFLAFLG